MEEMEKEIVYLRNQINMLKICLVITQVSAIIVLVSLLYQYSRLSRDYQELLQTCQGFLDTVKAVYFALSTDCFNSLIASISLEEEMSALCRSCCNNSF